jgi:ATP phosphoribosyltransferase
MGQYISSTPSPTLSSPLGLKDTSSNDPLESSTITLPAIPASASSPSANASSGRSRFGAESAMGLLVESLKDRLLFAVPKKGRLYEKCLELLQGEWEGCKRNVTP